MICEWSVILFQVTPHTTMPLPITIVYLQIMHHEWAITVTDVQVYSGVGYSLFLPIIWLYSWEYTSTNISKLPHQDFNGISFCRPRMALTCVQWPRKAISHGAFLKGGIGNEEWRIGLELIFKGIVLRGDCLLMKELGNTHLCEKLNVHHHQYSMLSNRVLPYTTLLHYACTVT